MRALRSFVLASLVVSTAALAGCPKRCKIDDPYCGSSKMDQIWLFGFSGMETDQILAKVRNAKGLIAVSFTVTPDGLQHLEILDHCEVSGQYRFDTYPMITDTLKMHSEDEAKALLPISWGAFSGAFKSSSVVEVAYKSPGAFEAPVADAVSISGDCATMTHVVYRIGVGAFETHVGEQTSIGASAGPGGPGGGGMFSSNTGSDRRVQAGSFSTCDQGGGGWAGPSVPDQCSQPISLRLIEKSKLKTNVEACNDDAFMAQGHGYSFDGKVFTVMSDQLQPLDSKIRVHFACDEQVSPAEEDAIAEIMSFLDQNPGVKAHISVRCNTASMMAFPPVIGPAPDLHANHIREIVAKYVSGGRLSIDGCYVPGATGVFVELTGGCKEGSAGQLACLPSGK
jgi:hypothetical protein